MPTIRQSVNEENVAIEAMLGDEPVRLVEFNIRHPEPLDITSVYDNVEHFTKVESPIIPQVFSGQRWLFSPAPMTGDITVVVNATEEQIAWSQRAFASVGPFGSGSPIVSIRGAWVGDVTRRFTGTVVEQTIEPNTMNRSFTILLCEELLEEE